MRATMAVLGTAIMLLVVTGHASAQRPVTPTETVNRAIATVMHILNDPALKQPGMAEARRGAIENVVRGFVSHQDMARRALGVTWSGLNESEQRHFVGLFIQLLRDAVACRLHDYSTAQVVYLSEHREGRFAEVRIRFSGDKVDTLIDVRLVNRSGDWLMYDAVIDGVSLVENYRAQFVQVMREASYVGLVGRIEAAALLHKSFEGTHMP